MNAVDVTELYRWPDVVIIATQGSCSLASLAGCGMLIYLSILVYFLSLYIVVLIRIVVSFLYLKVLVLKRLVRWADCFLLVKDFKNKPIPKV